MRLALLTIDGKHQEGPMVWSLAAEKFKATTYGDGKLTIHELLPMRTKKLVPAAAVKTTRKTTKHETVS